MVPGGGQMPVAITILSIYGRYRIALSVDKAAIPDYPEFFK
jgi:hypothetical protein